MGHKEIHARVQMSTYTPIDSNTGNIIFWVTGYQGFPIIFGQAHATIPGEEISFEKQVPLLQKVVRIHLPKLSTHMGLSENWVPIPRDYYH